MSIPSPSDPVVQELISLDPEIAPILEERDSASRLHELLPSKFPPSAVTDPHFARVWELSALWFLNYKRTHEALGLFWRLYQQMLIGQHQTRIHKGMPLVWMSECYAALGFTLALPFFIGLVDGESSMIRLYSTNCLYEFFTIDEQYKSIVVRFGEGCTADGSPIDLTVYIRDPILEWSTADVFKGDFRQLAYDVMSKWLEIEGDNVRLRRTGIYWHANWITNKPPDVAFERYAFSSASPEQLRQTLRYVEPLIGRLMSQMASSGGLAVEFPEYMQRIYSENRIECKSIAAVMQFLEKEGKRRMAGFPDAPDTLET